MTTFLNCIPQIDAQSDLLDSPLFVDAKEF